MNPMDEVGVCMQTCCFLGTILIAVITPCARSMYCEEFKSSVSPDDATQSM